MDKCVFIGDLHFKVSNMEIVNVFIEQILNVLKTEKTTCEKLVCVIGGDCLDTHEKLHQTPYNQMIRFIDSVRSLCETIILVGNHDYVNNQEFLSENHWMTPLKHWSNVTIVDKVVHKYNCVFVPYVYPGRFIEALNTGGNDWKKARCIFAHQELRGCKLQGNLASSLGDKWSLDNPQIVSGHIHKPHAPQKNILYPGSVIQHTFGEENNHGGGILIIDFRDKQLKFTHVATKIPSMRTVKMNAKDFKHVAQKLIKMANPLERVRLVCKGTEDEFKHIKLLHEYTNMPNNIYVRFQNAPFFEPRDSNEKATFDSVEKILYSKLKTCSETEKVFSHIVNGKKLDDLFENSTTTVDTV